MFMCVLMPTKALEFPGTGDTDCSELPDMGAGNQSQDLYKSIMLLPLSHLSGTYIKTLN